MKFLKRICSALNRFLSPQPGKNGSSMAFVMIIGAVLVIWVLAIMPLMVAVGNNSLTLQGSYADYLQSRSAIEFCKGELEKMVESKPPYTFCVVQNADGTYTPIPKMESGSLVTAYDTAVNRDPDSTGNIVDDTDTDDIPMESADGKKIVAICAVAQDTQEDNVYHITITTYNNGNKNLTYTADYTIRGSLLINPESYLKSQALPLSDFVVVDGKLGANEIWKSNIHDDKMTFKEGEENSVTNLSAIRESLLPYVGGRRPGDGYADSGIFPAVFKTPVYPAGGGIAPDATQPTEPDYTEDEWYPPIPVKEDERTGKIGEIWYKIEKRTYTYKNNYGWTREGEKDTIRIYLQSSEENTTDITEKCKIYLNGNVFEAYKDKNDDGSDMPTKGIHQVSIDFDGYNSVLAVDGLVLGEIDKGGTTVGGKRDKPTNLNVSVNGSTATLGQNSGARYGYSTSDDPYNVRWSSNNTFILEEGKTYFFFAYYPAATIDGVYKSASDVAYMGYVSSLEFVSTLTRGQKYLILGKSGSTYYAMRQEGRYSNSVSSQGVNVFFTGNTDINNDLLWTVGTNNGQYSFKNNRDYGKYLNMSGSYNNRQWTISFNLSTGSCNFTANTSTGSIGKYFSSGSRNTTRYIVYSNGFTHSTSVNTNNRLYFAKVPATPATPDLNRISVPGNTVSLSTNSIVHGTSLSSIVTGTYSKILANGDEVTSKLNVGKYRITAEVDNTTIPLGILNVTKENYSNLSATPSVSFVPNAESHEIIASTTYHYDSGAHWIGYRVAGSDDAYKWFPVDDSNRYTFVLPYGIYEFVVRESGTNTYNAAQSSPVPVELKAAEPEDTRTPSMMMGSSLYFMGREGSIKTEGSTIYLTTDLLVMRHDILGDGKVYVYPYSNEQNYDESPADTLFFPVNDMKNAANFEFKACTFYWIPAGTDINHATADDLNFENRPALSLDRDADFDKLKILLRKGDYPEINLDIAYIDRENKADKVNSNGTPNNEQLAHIVSGETIGWTESGVLDNKTDKNSSNDNQNRQFVVCAYVTSVKSVAINRTANRILIACEETDANGVKSYTLNVRNNISFTCRYFSIYADNVVQSKTSASFTVHNLGKDGSFIESIKKALGLTQYYSKSLQIDFERGTEILPIGSVIPAQIYRVNENSWNFFSAFDPQPLMVTYTNTELKQDLSGASNDIRIVDRYTTLTKGQDANLEIKALGECHLQLFTNYLYIDNSVNSYIFSNIEFESGWVDAILDALLGYKADFLVNSQESGYKSEYLGFFTKNSVESYSGTIIYIAPDAGKNLEDANSGIDIVENELKAEIIWHFIIPEVKTKLVNTVKTHIPSGFYYIPASDEGTSLKVLADIPSGVYGTINDTDKVHRINPNDLSKYSVYINKETGAMSDAFVDTGLIGNSDLGESGFSGGNVG